MVQKPVEKSEMMKRVRDGECSQPFLRANFENTFRETIKISMKNKTVTSTSLSMITFTCKTNNSQLRALMNPISTRDEGQ